MTEPRSRIARLLAISMLSTLIAGCIVTAEPPHRYYVGPVVDIAPPPPLVEEYGPAPGPGFVWIGGYWGWAGGRHEWVRGHWERGRAGERWVPHRWVHERDGWHMSQGHWEHRR